MHKLDKELVEFIMSETLQRLDIEIAVDSKLLEVLEPRVDKVIDARINTIIQHTDFNIPYLSISQRRESDTHYIIYWTNAGKHPLIPYNDRVWISLGKNKETFTLSQVDHHMLYCESQKAFILSEKENMLNDTDTYNSLVSVLESLAKKWSEARFPISRIFDACYGNDVINTYERIKKDN